MFPMALALGNTMILKPSERTPLTANRLAELGNRCFTPCRISCISNSYGTLPGRRGVVRHLAQIPFCCRSNNNLVYRRYGDCHRPEIQLFSVTTPFMSLSCTSLTNGPFSNLPASPKMPGLRHLMSSALAPPRATKHPNRLSQCSCRL